MQFVNDEIVTGSGPPLDFFAKIRYRLRQDAERRAAIVGSRTSGRHAIVSGRKVNSGSERVEQDLFGIETISGGWIAKPIHPIGVIFCGRRLMSQNPVMPYAAGLVNARIEA